MKPARLFKLFTLLALALALAFALPAWSAPPQDAGSSATEEQERAQRQAEDDAEKAEKQKQKAEEKAAREAEKDAARAARAAGTGSGGSGSSSRGLARTNERVLTSRLGRDAEIRKYVELVQAGRADAAQIAMLGNTLADAGALPAAAAYYQEALRLDPENADLWVNFGTIQRRSNQSKAAISAYQQAVSIDANHAVAHYNLGASYHDLDKYEDALKEYMAAFILDPKLADPRHNPAVVNNNMLLPLKVIRYQQQSGALGLPLSEIPGGEISD